MINLSYKTELDDTVKQLKPYLREYLLKNGVKFKRNRQFHCFNQTQHNNNDKKPSASITEDGLYFKCFACGLKGDIFTACQHFEGRGLTGKDFIETIKYLCSLFGIIPQLKNSSETKFKKYEKENEYIYTDQHGKPLYKIDRLVNCENKKDKKFYPYIYNNQSQNYNEKSGFSDECNRVLYKWPEVNKAIKNKEYIFFVEGEKCAEILRGLGLTATCISGGAMAWKKPYSNKYTTSLCDANVIILPDKDIAGEKFANMVAKDLSATVNEVKIIYFESIPSKGDIEQWLQLGGDRETLLDMAQRAPVYEEIHESCIYKAVYIKNSAYYHKGKTTDKQITNFIIVPKKCVEENGIHYFFADAVTTRKSFPVEFSSEIFTNKNTFKKAFQNAFLAFTGSDEDLQTIKIIISSSDFESKNGVNYLGVHKKNEQYVFVGNEKSLMKGNIPDETTILMPSYKMMETNILDHDILEQEEIKKVVNNLFKYNTLEKTSTIAGFASACFLKEHLKGNSIEFPHLSFFGQAGSGKTQTAEKIIKPMFGIKRSYSAGNTSKFTQLKIASSSNVLPFILDEYKPRKMSEKQRNDISELLRNAYNNISGTRGTAEQSLNNYDLINPIVIIGEESIAEQAVQERTLELSFSKMDFSEERKNHYHWMRENSSLITKFGRTLLVNALESSDEEIKYNYEEILKEIQSEIPSRLLNNIAVCLLGIKLIEKSLKKYNLTLESVIGLNYNEIATSIIKAVDENMLVENKNGASSIDITIDVFDRMAIQDKLQQGVDYEYIISSDGQEQLALDVKIIYDKFTRYIKEYNVSDEIITVQGSFTKQLRKTEYFASYKNVRFKTDKGHVIKHAYVINLNELAEKLDLRSFVKNKEEWIGE